MLHLLLSVVMGGLRSFLLRSGCIRLILGIDSKRLKRDQAVDLHFVQEARGVHVEFGLKHGHSEYRRLGSRLALRSKSAKRTLSQAKLLLLELLLYVLFIAFWSRVLLFLYT